jgi:hypothetical protein
MAECRFLLRIVVNTAATAPIGVGTAAAAACAPSTASASSTASTAIAASVTSAATGQSQLLGEWGRSSVFSVEDIERRQGDIGDFLLTKKNFMTL